MRIWLMAARLRTLPAAVAPVLVGTALAGEAGVFHPLTFIATLVGAIFIQVGTKKAKEFWMLCRQYDAQQALEMGLVNTVVPLERLEEETVQWCREMLRLSPFALRLVKASFHAHEDGFAGIQQLAHDANLLFYGSEEAAEGREAYKEKRKPDFSKFPKRP